MTRSLPMMTDEEVSRCLTVDDEAGFGTLATARGHLPLKAMEVNGQIEGLLAHLTLRQTFVNALDEPLEACYIFPLPDRMAVTDFHMKVGRRQVEGVLRERAAARHEYQRALDTGYRSAIAEEDRPGVFNLRVGNLLPGEEATVQLTLVGSIPYSDGEATFRFPFLVAPRYIPGHALAGRAVGEGVAVDTDAVPDASRISPPVLLPGFPNPVRLSLTLDIHSSGIPMGEFRCSLHTVLEGRDGDGVRRILLQAGERLDRDFILRFRVGDAAVRTALALHPDGDGVSKEGTFALTVVPPAGLKVGQRPRDVVFVLDRSGSMKGWKMVAARRAMARMVDTLTPRDRFTVFAFDDRIETPFTFRSTNLTTASDRDRFRAVEFLARVEARGGTEMAPALDLAVHLLTGGDPERERILVLVTDGQVANEDQILRSLGDRVRKLRLFTLGIDQAVNAGFLRRLADLGNGSCELVESEDRLDAVMDQVHRRIGSPVLTDLRLQPAGLQLLSDTLVPSRMADLFAGAPLCIWGRYQGAGKGSVRLQGHDAAGQPWSASVPAVLSQSRAIAPVWARGRIRELEDRFVIAQNGREQLEKQILDTSLRFGVLCRFTAFVAVDRTELVNAGGQRTQVTQPVEMPASWNMTDPYIYASMTRSAADLGGKSLEELLSANAPGYMSTDTWEERAQCYGVTPASSTGDLVDKLDRVRRPRVEITGDEHAECSKSQQESASLPASRRPEPRAAWRSSSDEAHMKLPVGTSSGFARKIWGLLIISAILLALAAGIFFMFR